MTWESVEIKIRENKRGGWKEHIKKTNPEDAIKEFEAIIDAHLDDENSSYQSSIKLNGGYNSRKPDGGGSTVVLNWKGKINRTIDTFYRKILDKKID